MQAQQVKQEKINNFYNQAKVAYSEENFEQAENLFKQVLEIDPEHSGAETYLNNYIPNKKQQLKAAAQREKERQQRIAQEKAEREARQKRLAAERKAREEKLQAQKEKQEKVDNLYRQAKNDYDQGQLDKAENTFNQIIEIDPDNAAANKYLKEYIPAKKEEKIKQVQEEKSDYITIVRKKTSLDLFNDAEYLVSQGKYSEALPIYNYAHDIARDDQLKRKIILAKERAKKTESEKKLKAEQKAKEDKRQARIAKQKAKREARQERLAAERKAKEEKQAAQRAKQEKINNLYHQAKVAYSNDNLDQSEKLFKQILKVDSNHKIADAYLNRHIPNKREQLKAVAQRQKKHQAKLALKKAQQKRQEKINNLYHQAKVAYTEENFDQAESLFKQVLKIDPEHSGAETYLNNYIPNKKQQLKAAAQREKERQQRIAKQKAKREARQERLAAERKAREKQQAAERAKQEKTNNLYHQAKVAYTKRELDNAEDIFNQVLEINPKHQGAEVYLEKIEIIREKRKQKQ
ncbi:MAG: tetratricopeptide repeat protein [Candidatus Omnitrophica bacterium]|nr:tetratricopeptide repeat protein [Candidatus Omnitrophota bacterium]